MFLAALLVLVVVAASLLLRGNLVMANTNASNRAMTPGRAAFAAILMFGVAFVAFLPHMVETGRLDDAYENAPVIRGRDNPHARQQVDATILSILPETVGSGKSRHQVTRVSVNVGGVAYSSTVTPSQAGIFSRGASEGAELYVNSLTVIGGTQTLDNPMVRYHEARGSFLLMFGMATLFSLVWGFQAWLYVRRSGL